MHVSFFNCLHHVNRRQKLVTLITLRSFKTSVVEQMQLYIQAYCLCLKKMVYHCAPASNERTVSGHCLGCH